MAARTRARDLPIPRVISEPDFKSICDACGLIKLPGSDRERLRGEINQIIKSSGRAIKEQRNRPNRKQRQRDLKAAATHIAKAHGLLSRVSRSSWVPLALQALVLARMVSVQWLREQIPGSGPALAQPGLSGLAGDVENEATRQQRSRVIEKHPIATLIAILSTSEGALSELLAMQKHEPGSRGGPKPINVRRDLIVMLAVKWERLGMRASTGPRSLFVAFIANVMDAMGWPSDLDTEGETVATAVREAMAFWRNLTKNVVR
jgi:hypothetical protein